MSKSGRPSSGHRTGKSQPSSQFPRRVVLKNVLTIVQFHSFPTLVRSCLKPCKLGFSMGFPGGSDDKESASNVGDLGSIPGLGRSPGGRHGIPLQYFCMENSHRQRSLAGCSSWGSQRVRHDWATELRELHSLRGQERVHLEKPSTARTAPSTTAAASSFGRVPKERSLLKWPHPRALCTYSGTETFRYLPLPLSTQIQAVGYKSSTVLVYWCPQHRRQWRQCPPECVTLWPSSKIQHLLGLPWWSSS